MSEVVAGQDGAVAPEQPRRDFAGTLASVWSTSDDEHDPEGVTVAFERAQVAGLLELARDELRELDLAEARIRGGTYGECLRCGRVVGGERLEVLPAARTCVSCADRRR